MSRSSCLGRGRNKKVTLPCIETVAAQRAAGSAFCRRRVKHPFSARCTRCWVPLHQSPRWQVWGCLGTGRAGCRNPFVLGKASVFDACSSTNIQCTLSHERARLSHERCHAHERTAYHHKHTMHRTATRARTRTRTRYTATRTVSRT